MHLKECEGAQSLDQERGRDCSGMAETRATLKRENIRRKKTLGLVVIPMYRM
jgi:hypothetical protein